MVSLPGSGVLRRNCIRTAAAAASADRRVVGSDTTAHPFPEQIGDLYKRLPPS